MTQPLLLLSTVIFKHAQTGGEVVPHQDSAHLYTEPPSCLGLKDADIENGRLSAVPGGHHSSLTGRYRRHPKGGARFDPPGPTAFPEAAFQPLSATGAAWYCCTARCRIARAPPLVALAPCLHIAPHRRHLLLP